MRRRISVLAGLSLALVAPLACRDHSTDPRLNPPAAATPSGGDTQTGTVASRLGTPLAITVKDAKGIPLGGVAVVWAADGTGAGTVDPAQTITDANGQASAFWMLGTVAGVQHAHASVASLPAVAFTATATPDQPSVVKVAPDSVVLDAVGDTARLTATVTDKYTNVITGAAITWRSSDTTVATVNSDGRLTSRTEGTVQVSATVGAATGSSRVRVAQLLSSVSFARDTATLTAVNDTIRLKAIGKDKNGVQLPTVPITYALLDTLIAQSDSLGKVTARANGVARIVATSRGRADTAQVTVSQVAVSLRIKPAPDTINAIGDTVALSANVVDRNGFTVGGTEPVVWATTSSLVIVDATGHVISRAVGVAYVKATRNGMVDSAQVTVRQVLASVLVTAPSPTVTAGVTAVFVGVARDSNGVAIPGTALTWTTSDATIATVDNTGHVQGAKVGQVRITAATSTGASGVATVQVLPGAAATVTKVSGDGQGAIVSNPVLDSLVVKVLDAFGNLAVGANVQWAATAGGGTPSPATSVVDSSGLARTRYTLGGAAGLNTIGATVGALTPVTFNAEATVPVGPAGGSVRTPGDVVVITLPAGAVAGNVPLAIAPIANPVADPGFVPGTSFEFGPTGTVFSTPVQVVMHFDPTQIPAGTAASELVLHRLVNGVWQEVVPSSVDVVNNTITASLDHFSIYGILRERVAHIITAAPDTMTFSSIGATQPIVVTLFDIHGFVLNPRLFTYTSANTAVATVNSTNGVVTSTGSGTTKVAVTIGPLGDTVVVKVLQVATSIGVTPATATLNAIGATQQLADTVRDAHGVVMPTAPVTWTTSNAAVATVSTTGLVTAVANGGPVTITATSGTATGTAAITVTQVATTIAVSAGNAQTATANTAVAVPPAVLVTDANGHPVAGIGVTFAATAGNGTIVGGSATTGANGIAAVTSWTLGTAAGAESITATSTGLTGSPVTFTATASVGAADGPHSSIAALPISITANGTSTSTVTVTLRDVNNNPLTASGGTVVVSRTGTGTLSAVTDNHNGTYTATLTAPVTAGAANITATINTVAVAGSANVDFVAGALNHFLVEAAAGGAIPTQSAGTPFNIKITAQDANNNTVTGFTGTVDLTSNRTGSAGLTTTAAFTAGVLASHAVTLTQSGAASTITATHTGAAEAGTSAAFTVNGGALHHFVVEAAAGGTIATQTAGTAFNIKITAQDVNNNTATSFTGTVDVTSNRTGTTGLVQSVAFTAGVLSSHSVTLTTPTGSGATITVTNHGSTETGTSTAFALNPGSVTHFLVEAAGGGAIGTQTAGTSFNVQFTAQDASNNTVTGFTGTVDVTLNRTGTAGLTQSAAFIAGVLASHSVTLTTPTGAGATITATNHGSSETGTSAAFTLNSGGLTHFKVEAAGGGALGTQTVGTPFNVQFTAQDASNNTVTSFTGTVDVALNRTGTAGLTQSAAFTAGVLSSHSVTLTTPTGAGATITATNHAGTGETGTSAAFTLNAGAVTHFKVEAAGGGAIGTQVAGTAFNVQFTAQDAFNNTATSFTGTVDVTSNRTGTTGLTQSASFTAGVLSTHSVTLTTPTGAGATITATNHGSTETGTSSAFTLNPGGVTHFLVEAAGGGALGTQTAGTPFNVQFTAQDASNNTVTGFTGTVDVTSNRTGTSGLTQSAAFTAGVLSSHSVTLTTPTGSGATITATNHAGTGETGTSAAFTLNPGALAHFKVEAAGGGAIATQTAGTPFNVQFTAQDAFNNTQTSFVGTVDVTSNRTGTAGLTQSVAFTAGVLSSHSVTLTTPTGAGATITATNHGSSETGTSAAFTLNPGAVAHFKVEAAGGGAIAAQTAGVPFNVQFTAQDAFNNTATSFAGTVDVTSNRTGTAGLTQSASFTAGVLSTHSVTLTAPTGSGATITATNHGSTETGTSAAFTLNPGGVDHFLVEAAGGGAIGTQTAGVAFNVQFTAQDASNNTVTSFTGAGNTVNVTSNKTGTAGLTTSATFTNGVLASHSITLTTPTGAGATITATRTTGGTESGTSAAFTLNPGALAHFKVEAAGGGAIATQTAGTPFNVQFTAQDAFNNTATGFIGTVDVTSNRTGTSGLTQSAGFTAGVLSSHSVTLTTPTGSGATITATNHGSSETGTSAAFTLNPGALAHFKVEAAGGGAIGTQAAGTPFNVQFTAQDAFNNTATSFVGTVDVTSNRTGTSGLTQSASFTAGVLATHSVTLTTPTGSGATITATNHSSSETGTSNAFTLNPGGVDHFLVEAAGGGAIGTQTAGVSFNVQFTAQDASNNTVTSFTGAGNTVNVTSNKTGTSGLVTSATFTNGVLASHSITLTTPTGADATITATRTSGGTETGTSAAFTLNPGALHHFTVTAVGGATISGQVAGQAFTTDITARDAFGNKVTSFIGTVDVTSNRTGTAGLTQSAAFTAGLLSGHSITLTTPTGAGATVTATNHAGTGETGTSNAFQLDAGAVDHFDVEAAGGGSIGTQAAGTPFNVLITARDIGGNTATSFTGTVDVTSNRTGSSGLTQSAAFTGGVLASHSITLTTPTGAGATITATNHGGAQTGTSNAFTLNAGTLDHFLVEAAGGGAIATQTAGVPFNVQFTAQDVANNTVTSFTGAGNTVNVTSNRTGTAGLTTSATFTNGVLASHSITLTTATGAGATITATRTSGGSQTGTSASFTLNTGALNHFAVEAQGGGPIGAHAAGVSFNIQITAQDAGNNTVTSFTGAGNTVDVTSNRTASQGINVTSATFTSGVLASHAVTLTQSGAGATITATKTGSTETGTSNTFTIGTPPTVTSTVPTNNAVSVSPNATITVNFSTSVNATTSSFAIECPIGTSKTYTLSSSPAATFTLTPTSALPAGQSCRLTVIAAQVTDASTTAPMQTDVTSSFETSPTTGIDTYPQTVIGNMSVQSANVGTPYSFTTNDQSAESFTITASDATSAHGGTVSGVVTSGPNIGQFVYNPPAGYHGPNDTFTYTITTSGGSTAIGTVTMPISGMVWYIDANAGTNGDGRMSNPFNSLASFNAINDGTGNHPAQGDNIFLYETNAVAGYVGPLTLLAHQRLIGQDAGSQLQVLTTLSPPSSSVAFPVTDGGTSNGTNVTITSLSNAITTATGDSLIGFRVGGNNGTGSVAGIAIGGTGNLYIRNVAITQGATGGALSLSSGAANIVLDSTRSSGGTNAVSLTTMTGSVNLQNVGTIPSALSGASGATISVNGGSVGLTVPATVTQANNAAVVSVTGGHTGTINFNGTVSATNGTGLQFNNADGTYSFNLAVTVNTSASQALNISNGSSGAFNLTVGSTAFTNQTGTAVVISNSAPTVDYRGTITKSSVGNGLISITGLTGGTVSFSGLVSQTTSPTPAIAAISDSSNTGGTVNFSNATKTLTTSTAGAVNLRNNTGSTINFTNGGLAITTTSATGFLSSGGGTINVSGSGNTISTSAGGTGLTVQNPTANALTFQSISTSSAVNGIVMVNTGTGGLTVTGNGGRCDVGSTTCTGGTISGATGADGAVAGNGIYLSSAPNVSLTRMRVAGTVQNFGLYGTTVSGLSLNTMLFDGTFGTATTEAALGFDEMTGTPSIINSSIFPASGSFGDGIRILNTTGTALTRLTMTADTVGFTGTNGTNGVNILARGSNTTNVTVQNSTFRGGKNKTFVFTDSVSATTNLIFTNNLIQQGTGPYGAGALAALNIRTSGATTHTDSIAFNTFTNLNNPNNAAFEFNPGLPGLGLSGSVDSYIGHNTWGTSGSANSGPAHNAVNIDMRGSGTTRFKVADNAMYQYGDHAFRADTYDDGASSPAGNHNGKMDLTFVRNTIQEPRSTATFVAGVQLDAGRTSGGAMTMCVNFGVGGLNNMNNSGSTDADTPFDILSNTTGNGSFVKYLNYSGSDTGASGLAEGKLDTLIRAGISSSTFDGFLDLSQAALVTSSANNASGAVCNLPAAP